jgi:hypothetical protein
MKKLLNVDCGVKPIQKGPDGWENHAINYYYSKTRYMDLTEKRLQIRKLMKEKHFTQEDESTQLSPGTVYSNSDMNTGLSFTHFE